VSQQPQSQLQTQHSADKSSYILDNHHHHHNDDDDNNNSNNNNNNNNNNNSRRPWWWRWYVPPKRLSIFNRLRGVIFQTTELFIRTVVDNLLNSLSGGWSPPLGTGATDWPIVPATGDYDGELGGMKIGRGNRSTRRKPVPAPLCPPQIPLDKTRDRTRAAAVWNQRLTAWAMARPLPTVSERNTKFLEWFLCLKIESRIIGTGPEGGTDIRPLSQIFWKNQNWKKKVC
jgi:hypothetical protein